MRSMCSTGDEGVMQDMVDQGAINQLTGTVAHFTGLHIFVVVVNAKMFKTIISISRVE